MPAAPQVFISYRRDDGAGYARAIAAELAQRFGSDRVFIDVDDITAGQGFAQAIQRAVGAASVLLVLIGRRWRGEREGLPARLDDPADFVRLEVAAGLRNGMRVIPLLLDGASMPPAADLPDEIRSLAGLQALELGNTRFAADIDRLSAALFETLGPPARSKDGSRRLALAGLLGSLVLVTAAWLHFTARPPVNGEWLAELRYDWEPAPRSERFIFSGDRHALIGSATFLGVPRGVIDGRVDRTGLRFSTRTGEMGGTGEQVHRYTGRLADDGRLRFVLQTEGGTGTHVPIEFIARRADPGQSP